MFRFSVSLSFIPYLKVDNFQSREIILNFSSSKICGVCCLLLRKRDMDNEVSPPLHQSPSPAFFPSPWTPALSPLIQARNGRLTGLLASNLLFSQSIGWPCLHLIMLQILSSFWLPVGETQCPQPEIQIPQHLYLFMLISRHFLTQKRYPSQCGLFVISPRKFMLLFFCLGNVSHAIFLSHDYLLPLLCLSKIILYSTAQILPPL